MRQTVEQQIADGRWLSCEHGRVLQHRASRVWRGKGAWQSRFRSLRDGRQGSQATNEPYRNWIRKAMDEGAMGVASALIYPPGAFQTTDELVEIVKVGAANDDSGERQLVGASAVGGGPGCCGCTVM